jgi:transposase-like protein
MKRRPARAPTPAWAADLEGSEPTGPILRRPADGRKAFGLQIHLFRSGAFSKAVALFCGDARYVDAAGVALREALTRALASCDTVKTRRGVGELHAMIAAELRLGPGGYRAQGSAVYFGAQHQEGVNDDGEVVREYIRKGAQGGLAQRLGVCVRTVYRWWRILVRAGVWKAWRPPRAAPGAMTNRSGSQVYSQRALATRTPRALAAQLPLRDDRRARSPGHRGPMLADEFAAATAWIDGLEYLLY